MTKISTGSIKNSDKKNEMILFAQNNGCKAQYCSSRDEMVIYCPNLKLGKLMKEKIKQLSN